MLIRRVAVAPTFGGEAIVGSAEVCGGQYDGGSGNAPPYVLDAANLEARAADLAALEQRLAQPNRRHSETGLHQVAVSTRAADRVARVGGGVVGGACGLPFVD